MHATTAVKLYIHQLKIRESSPFSLSGLGKPLCSILTVFMVKLQLHSICKILKKYPRFWSVFFKLRRGARLEKH
jgi:hypothetical protein